MLFTKQTSFKTLKQAKTMTMLAAHVALASFPIKAAEAELDIYCLAHYHMKLKFLCRKILMNCSINLSDDGNALITIPDAKLNEIATLITFGNSEVPGSDILRTMFK